MNEGTVRGTFDLSVPAFAKMRTLHREARGLERTLERLGRMRVRPVVEVAGIARAREEVALLRRELQALGRMSPTPIMGRRGGGGGGTAAAAAFGAAAGGGGRGGRGGAIRTLDLGPLSLSPRAWPVLAGIGLPAITGLVGATGALAGTIMGAGAVGGATALAGGGALATGMGTIIAVAKPLTEQVKEAHKAQEQYNEAVRQYGRGSTQAVTAAYNMNRAFQQAPQGTRRLIRDANAFSDAWERATRSAQRNIIGFYREGISIGRRATPVLGPAAGRTTGALRRETRAFGRGIFGDPRDPVRGTIGARGITQGAAMFDENLRQFRRFGVGATTTMIQLGIAARPFLLDATRFMANWSEGWADSTSDIGKVRRSLGQMVPYVRSIRRFMFAGGRLIFHGLFQGAPAGRSMLDRATAQLRTWDRWVQRNPHRVRAFFRETVQSTEEMARALFRIGRELAQIGQALLPVLDRFSQLISVAGDIGLLHPGALAIGIGALRGARGRGRGARGAAGGIGAVEAAGAGVAAGRFSRARAGAGRGALGALRGAGRAAWPVALGFGALDFATFQGNVGQRLGAAISGATFGLVPGPQTNAMVAAERLARVEGFAEGAPAGLRGIERLRGRRARIGRTLRRPDVSPEMTRMVNEQLREEMGVVNRHLRERLRAWREFADARSAALGERRAERFQAAFRIRRRDAGPEAALTRTTTDVLGEMRGMRREGARILGQNTIAWARTVSQRNPELVEEYRALRRRVVEHFRGMGDSVALIQGRILIGSQRIWPRIRKALTDPANQAAAEVSAAFTRIQRQAVGGLVQMGYTRQQARNIVRAHEQAGRTGFNLRRSTTAPGATGQYRPQATGGRLGGFRIGGGAGLGDSINLGGGARAAAGELVINRHTERQHDREAVLRGLPTLGQRVRFANRRHAMPFRDSEIVRNFAPGRGPGRPHVFHARGGRVYPDAMGALPGLDALAYVFRQKFGLRVISGLRPGAITTSGNPSDHGWGGAIDISNGVTTPQMDAAWRWMGALGGWGGTSGVQSGGPFKQALYRTMVGGDHFNHIHAALLPYFARNPDALMRVLAHGGALRGMRGMGFGQLGQLRIPGTRLRGVPGAMSRRAQETYATALRRSVNRRIGAMGVGIPGSGGGSPTANMRLGQQMMLRFGWGADQWPSLRELWTRESNWLHTARNPSSGAYGIPQALPPGKMGAAAQGSGPAAARAQILWGMRYIRGRYGAPAQALAHHTAHNWYAMGGRLPAFGGWFGQGGGGFARRPTMIGLGDRLGGEDFAVRPRRPGWRPAHGPGRGARAGRLGALHVHFHGPVTVRGQKDIDDITEGVARRLLAAIDDGRGEDDD